MLQYTLIIFKGYSALKECRNRMCTILEKLNYYNLKIWEWWTDYYIGVETLFRATFLFPPQKKNEKNVPMTDDEILIDGFEFSKSIISRERIETLNLLLA